MHHLLRIDIALRWELKGAASPEWLRRESGPLAEQVGRAPDPSSGCLVLKLGLRLLCVHQAETGLGDSCR